MAVLLLESRRGAVVVTLAVFAALLHVWACTGGGGGEVLLALVLGLGLLQEATRMADDSKGSMDEEVSHDRMDLDPAGDHSSF